MTELKENALPASKVMKVIDYIEAHLKDDREGVLDNATLARVAGYSEYHFLRLFRATVSLTPADYIRKRRLTEIVRRIGDSARPMSDIAFEYGFNSKENFTRAFKTEHNILPTQFREVSCSLRLYEPFDPDPAEPTPAVSLAFLQDFTLIVYPSDIHFPPHFWNCYNAEGRSARLSGGRIVEDYGAMLWDPQRNCLDYFIGIREEDAKGDRTGTVELSIKGGLYALFDTAPAGQHDFVATIRHTWDWIGAVWLPQNGYRRSGGFELESYVESGRDYSERIYIPLIKE